MRQFEVGMTIEYGNIYKVLKRTNKTVTIEEIQHYGRYNERTIETRTFKIRDWRDREVVIWGSITLEA